ncbi:MAG: DEAD/DEAH box helicase family protein [Syntrophaceae bacterium]|nr:DEAD/DEAH box helicase family protein [Syntrophaceae bacterium]
MESGDAPALANEPPAQDTLRAINLTIAEEEKILKAQAQEKGFGAGNTLFTEDKAAKARAILKAKLSGAQLNAGIDPEILTAGIDLAGYYIEGGVRKFADFTAKMVEDIGEQIRPYLKSLYLAVRNYPGFDNAGMETEADIEKSLTAAAATDKIAAKGEKSHADSSDLDAGAAGNAPAAAASARQAEQNAGRLPEDVRAVVSGIEGQARREGSEVPQGVNLPAEIQAHAEQYLYHATYAEKIAGINAAGLDPTKSNQYIYGNDTTKRVYLSPDQELSLAFGDVLLRVRRSALNQKLLKEIARQGGQEVWYFDRIAPSLIERFTPRGEWVALSAQTEKIPQSVAVTTGIKTPKTKESAYMAAVGLISGGRADRARVRGYEFAYGPADAATKSEMVGLFSGLAADKLLAAGITIQRTGPPAAFKIGDRVAMKNGRHGKIIADESYTMTTATIFGGQREVKRYENYRVRTDAGAEFGMIKPEDLTKETEKPAEPVVPDIREPNGIFEPPDKVLYHITLARSDERKYRAQAQRMRKRSNIDSTLRDAELQKKKADELQRLYDDWAAKYPAEAAKYAPAKTPPPASVSATTGIPAAVPSPQPSTLKGTSPVEREGETTLAAYGLTVTKGSTNTGKTVWNVSGTETRTWKDYIKQAGGRWYGPKKVWSFYNGDPAAALLQTLPPIDQVHPSIREKYAAKPTAAAAKAYPDLTVSGQPQPVPDHPDASYVVHIRKPDLIPDTFRVVVSAQRAAGGGFLTQAGTGMTPEQAYDNALANYDRTIETRRSSTNQDAESVTNTTTPIDNEKTNDYNKIEQEAQDAPSDRHDTDETSSEDDRAGAQGPGTRDVSATSDERSTSGVSQGTRRADDEHVRGPVRGTLQGSIRHESDLSGTSPAPDFRTQPGVGRNNGDVADVQRSATGERTDHVITPGAIDRTGSWFQTAQNNLDIIELAKKIQTENRPATPTEQALLARYTGFGASEIANRMFPGWAEAGEIQLWRADQKWKPLVERMQKLFSPAEIATAARSTQYAHYTSPAIIDSIYKALDGFGFPGGRVLEPGMGVGSFFGLMPESMRTTTKYTGIEMDGITAQIAKLLYPRQNIIEGDYTKAQFPNNYFDLAIGNPPYAKTMILADPDYKKLRLSLHDFFFVKSLDKIRPGGLMVFITSRYTMDKVDSRVRKILNEKSDLLGAVRLPQTAFAKNAGTEVVTDVIFLRKKVPGEKSAGMMWGEVAPVTTPEGDFRINEYYLAHPEMVLGDHSGRGKMQNSRDPQYTVLPREGNIEEAFAQAVTHLPKAVYSLIKAAPAVQEAAAIERDFNPQNKKEGGLYLSPNGQVMVTESGAGVPITAIAPKLSDKDRRWLTSYITLRDAVKQCQYDQLTDGDWESSLKELNRVYKAFKMAWGRINAFTITERKSTDEDGKEITIHLRKFANSRLLRLDVESPLVMALEKVTEDFQIADGPFLSSRTIKKPEPPQISTVADALAVSLNEKGRLDLAHIASLMGASEADVFEQLGDLVYDTPDKGIQLADAYLSGNVVKKLEEAKAAAKIDPKYERNVQALIASLPKPLTAKDITPSPGATWIPLPVYNDFLHEVLELPESAAADHSPADNQWTISGLPVQSQRGRASAWSSPDRGANEIFSAVLNNATLKVYKTGKVAGVEKTYLDPAATAQVNDIAKKMKIRFRNWVWENAGRAHELLNIYNSTRNNIVPRRFDGSHLTLPGVSLRFKLMPHQKNAIWRIIQDGNTYIAHAVGAGKTYEMVAAGMEMKRLSLISKPLYVVPNHMLQQFANEFQELYPLAHVMVADEQNFHTTNRRRFMAQAALNNPDAIVITHSAFGLLKMKQENILPVRNDVVSEMQAALDDLEGDKKANRIRIKQMEARIEQTEQRFESMIAQGDNVITFEDMGVDFLFVDEAHQFRKLDFTTNRQAKGIDPSGSVRAMMLYIKTQWLDRQNPGRSHVFASGTPITNTMGELYTVMKFFDMDGLRRDGLDYFDSWAAEYGDMNSAPEMNAAGRYEIVDRFSRFVNVPELMSRVRSFMDVLTSSQLGAFVKRPKVRGGQPTIVVTPASPALKNYQTNVLLPRIESSKNWKPSKEEPGNPDPLINIITDGRLASIDMRFVAPGSPNDPDSKLNKYIDKIIEHYKETAGHTYLDPATGQKSPVRGAAQICFYNHGFGRGVASSRGFDARAWAMRRFKEAGIPVDEIAWIDDFDTAAKKEAVMKEVRNGHKRILIGSAKKMGTGMNVQTRLSHMTYLDPPWYPSDVEQPVGRILRQGNQNEEVGIFYFSTKGSYDATMWQMVTRKAKFIEDALAGGGARAIEDISESSLYEMAAALASGDERAIRLAGLRNEIEGLENLRSAHYHTQTNLQRQKRLYEIGHPGKKAYVAKLEAAMQKVPFDLRYLSAQHPIKAKLGHRDYTDRKAFAQDLLAKIVALRNAGTAGTTPIGHFFGLELRVVQAQGGNTEVWDRSGQTELIPGKVVNQLQLRITDDVIYDVASDITDTSDAPGLVTRLTNRAKAVPSDLAQAKQSLEETETELKKINARLGAPFELARELEEKIAEAAQIDADLVREGQATTAAQQQQHTAPAQTPDQTPPDTSGPMLSRQDKTAHRRPHRLGDVELDEMVQQLAALLKGVEIVKHGNEIRLKTRSGEEVRIESAEQIDPSTIALAIKKHYSQDKKQTPQSGAGVAGMYSAGKITLVEDMAGIWTLSHEFYHFLEDIGAISNADKATLNRKIAYLITSQPETYGYLQGRSLPEQRADYVGRTLTGMYDATTPTGTILARIREVIDRILNALGIRTARGILRDIETGKIYKDQGERNKGQEKGKTPLLRQDIDNIRERAYYTYGEGGKHETSVSDSGFDGEGSRQYPGRDAALRFQPTVVGREKKGSIPAAGRIVRTPHDAAKIAATYLNKYPDEHMISLVLDAKGKVISVYHHTIGLPGSSQVSMPILAGEAMNTPGASSIIVAHNHPSQNAEFSPEDRAFARQLNNLLTGSGVTMRDFLAVAQKQYSSYSENMLVYVDDSVDINSARSGVKIPIVGRIFESVRSPLLKVSSAEDALPLAQQYIPDGGTLILDGQNAFAGFSTIQNYGRIRGDAQRAILQDIEKRNGRAMIVYSPGRIVGTAESFNLGKFIAATGGQVRLLDIIDSSGSHADNGDMPAIPTADSSLFLSVAEDVTEKAANAAGRKVSRAVDLITGRVSPEKRETLSALRKSWAEFWRPFSTVPNGEEVLARRYESMGNVAKAVRFIETMKAELDQFPPETKKDIFWYLNGDIPLTVLPEDAQTFAKNIQRRTEIIGEMLVDRGLLTEETFEAHKGTYVHYLYAKHIVGEDATVGITSSGKLDLSYTLRRNPDLTMQQRKELGLIDDASVAVPVGMGKALTDIAKFDYLETIAENPDWVWQPSVVRVAVGKKLKTPVMGRTRRYVMMGIGKLQEQVRTYDEMMRTRPTTEVAEIHKILTDAWQKEQAKTQNAPADFVQLPNTRGYGPLAGAFVKKPIADDLRPVMDVNTDRGKLLNTVLEIERQGMAAFKMGKVALNIPTACRNIVSNIIQNNMRGRALAKIPGDIVAACQSMKARDAHYEEAFGMGLFNTNWFVTEINDVLNEFRKIESGRIDQILSAVKNVAKYYGRIDDISKFAIFLQMRKAGAPIDKAAIEAMKWGMDYSLTSRSIKGLRQTIMPFATYQYKIAPLIAESLGKRPWVLAKFALIYPAAKLAAMALHDLDDDDWEDLEKQLPAYIKKSGSMMILPWKTDKDQWQWVNLEYYFPFGNMLAIFRDAKALDSGEALRDLGISNPFLSMFYTGLSAREDSPPLHAYSGIPIYNELDPGWMKAAKYLEYMANTWLPGMLTRQGALGYTGKAIAGGEDRWGREVSFGQALGRWFGFNIVSVSPEQSRAQVSVKIQDLHKEMARIEADPSRSDEAKAEYRARMNEELSQMAEQAPAAVLPITKAKGPDPVYDALRTMAARGILHTGPPSRTLEIGGIPRKMTLEQYREYLDRSSDIARRKLAALVTSPSWETMTDERKTQVVSGIVANARKAIRQKIKAQLAREFRGQQFRPQNSEKRS